MIKLSNQQLEDLRQFDTPTVSNVIETFNIRPRTSGFTNPQIKAILPLNKPIVGYACTAKISAKTPPTAEQKEMLFQYYQNIKDTQKPVISVIQDIDPIPVGSFWGEVQATIHKALGCIGTVTNGGVRDIDAVDKMNFAYFANCVLVSHAYVHIVSYNCEVEIGGLIIKPNNIIIADRHGVLLIPDEIVTKLIEACRKSVYAEMPVLEGCKRNMGKEIDINQLREWIEEMNERRNKINKRVDK